MRRRSFIKAAGLAAAGHVAGLRPFGNLAALASTTGTGYKALVCIYLGGGNDANNMLVPNDTAGYMQYAAARGPLALTQSSLLPLTSAATKSGNLALHNSMPELQQLFSSSNFAMVANVGNLVEPITQAQWQANSLPVPNNLFAHPNQSAIAANGQATDQSAIGWGGRMADVLTTQYPTPKVPMIISLAGNSIFCNGTKGNPAVFSAGGINAGNCHEKSACSGRLAAAQQLLSFDSGLTMVQADAGITSNAYVYAANMSEALQSGSALKTVFPANNLLAAQLQQIAQIMQVQSQLGAQRQIFFATLGGFDTHSNQLAEQAPLLQQLSQGMSAFYSATVELGIQQSVTTFTISEFARALQGNTTSGSDHAWGSHHMILGGAVKGGLVYGAMPEMVLGGPNDSGANGRWIPTTGFTPYAATLANWFGVGAADMPTVLPLLANFPIGNLGFV